MNDRSNAPSTRLALRWLPRLVLGLAVLVLPGLHADDKSGLPPDLQQVPDQVSAVISFQAGKLSHNPLFKELMPQVCKGLGYHGRGIDKDALGVPPESVERLTLVPETNCIIVRTNKPYDRDQVLGRLGAETTTREYAGKTLQVPERKHLRPDSAALWLVDDRVFVKGPPFGLQRLLDLLAKSGTDGLPTSTLVQATVHDFTVVVDPAAFLRMEFGQRDEYPAKKPRPKDIGPKKASRAQTHREEESSASRPGRLRGRSIRGEGTHWPLHRRHATGAAPGSPGVQTDPASQDSGPYPRPRRTSPAWRSPGLRQQGAGRRWRDGPAHGHLRAPPAAAQSSFRVAIRDGTGADRKTGPDPASVRPGVQGRHGSHRRPGGNGRGPVAV